MLFPKHRLFTFILGRKSWRRTGELLLLSFLGAVGVAFVNPLPEGPPKVSLDELRGNPSFSEILWVDARSEMDYSSAHVPGAVWLNEQEWEVGLIGFMAEWEPGVDVVVYCGDESCGSSSAVAARLMNELELEEVFVLENGWAEWESAEGLQ